MTELTVRTVRGGRDDAYLTAIADLAIIGNSLVTVTHSGGGGMAVWSLAGLGNTHKVGTSGTGIAGVEATLTQDGQGNLLVSGVARTGLWSVELSGGQMTDRGAVLASGGADLPSDIDLSAAVRVGTTSYIYTAGGTAETPDIWRVTGDDRVQAISQGRDAADLGAGISAMATAQIGTTALLVTASRSDNGVTAHKVRSNGTLDQTDTLGAQDGLGLSAPTALETVQLGAETYLLVTGAGSQSLSVMRLDAAGRLTATDHVVDSRDTRFADATHLAVAEADGKAFVAVAGSDDGISLLQLLPGGKLLHLDTFADTDAVTLANVSGLEMRVTAGRVEVIAASLTEPGLTVLAWALDGADRVLTGNAGANRLTGGAGDDILIDGAGADTLVGGAGADTFQLVADGTHDVVQDFTPGQDRLDLSLWGFLRDVDQLDLRPTATGAQISFRGESLTVLSANGKRLEAGDLWGRSPIELDHYDPSWIAQVIAETAEQDRNRPSPTQPPEPDDNGGSNDLVAVRGDGTANVLEGSAKAERLEGMAGADELNGRAGNDKLDGGTGADLMIGGIGSDVIHVDHVGDRVIESRKWEGHDLVVSEVSFRMGRSHIEDLYLTGTARVGAGNGLANEIRGNNADNVLDGGTNVDTLKGGRGDDIYLIRSPGDSAVETPGRGIDTVKAFRAYKMEDHIENLFLQTVRTKAGEGVSGVNGIGNDLDNVIVGNPFDNKIAGRGGNDTLRGQAGSDTFIFDQAASRGNVDRVVDFTPGEDKIWLHGATFGLTRGDLTGAAFHLGDRAGEARDRVIYDTETGALRVDADGTGPGAAGVVAVLLNRPDLEAGDIFIF